MPTDKDKGLTLEDKYSLVGMQAPAADGADYGIIIIGYNPHSDDFIVVNIFWSQPKVIPNSNHIHYLDSFKASYRYQLDKAIPIVVQ